MNTLRLIACLISCAGLMALGGCSSVPKPTKVQLALEAAASVNPDVRNRPSPVVVRVFELKSLAAFNGSDFFSLWDHDKETLGTELVGRDEYTLRPGDSLRLDKTLQPETLYVGAIAAFRDLERSQWRANVRTPSRKVKSVTVRVTGKAVSVEAK